MPAAECRPSCLRQAQPLVHLETEPVLPRPQLRSPPLFSLLPIRIKVLLSEYAGYARFPMPIHSSTTSGSCPRTVIVTAAPRINPPPSHAYGPRCSPRSSTPRIDPNTGSTFKNTPAREVGTWWIPQFQSSVVRAVPATPLTESAIQAVALRRANG